MKIKFTEYENFPNYCTTLYYVLAFVTIIVHV